MTTFKRARLIVIVVAVLLFSVAGIAGVAQARVRLNQDAAIALAAAHPVFKTTLDARPGWTAKAYNSENAYNIWRVTFWDSGGETLGWANVSVDRNRVFSYEANNGVTEEQRSQVGDKLWTFVQRNAEVRQLLGRIEPNESHWYDYHGWLRMWVLVIDRGRDSISVAIKNDSENPMDLRGLKVVAIDFPNLQAYDEWAADQHSKASLVAFAQPEIAAALRDKAGWTTKADQVGEKVWKITFCIGEQHIAEATVDLAASVVVEYKVF